MAALQNPLIVQCDHTALVETDNLLYDEARLAHRDSRTPGKRLLR